jgi:hypothetical protein
MKKIIYDSHKPDELYRYNNFERFMSRQKGSELVQSRNNLSSLNYQVWHINGITLHYTSEKGGASDHIKIRLFGSSRKISEIERIING